MKSGMAITPAHSKEAAVSAPRRAPVTAEQTVAEAAAAEKFIADLIARGEVVEKKDPPAPGGGASGRAEKRDDRQNDDRQNDALPPGVTHEIVHRDGDKAPAVRRRRYSAF
jgi:hypothetical protein